MVRLHTKLLNIIFTNGHSNIWIYTLEHSGYVLRAKAVQRNDV